MPFTDTENKAAIRRLWNSPILTKWHSKINKPLSYFGMPGPEIRDLLEWKNLLGLRTGVEYSGHTKKEREKADEAAGLLNTNIMAYGLSSKFQLLRADIEDIIINSVDDFGTVPILNDGQPAHLTHFRYDLINLDFCGGLGYQRKDSSAKRVKALKKLFERQEGHDFILFLTINVRDTLGDEITEYLSGLKTRNSYAAWQTTIDWYLSRSEGEREYKLKATVPSFILAVSEPRMYRVKSYPPVVYVGHENARMLHFVFEMENQQGNLRAFSLQDDQELMQLPLVRCENGELKVVTKQHPNFDFGRCATAIEFLPQELKTLILSRLPTQEELNTTV